MANEKNRTRDMGPWNRLTAARGEGDKGGKKGKGLGPGVLNLLVSLCHTGRRVILGYTLNIL